MSTKTGSSEADEVSKIQEAFERLNSTITPSDARAFQSTTLQDVRDAAVRIENQQAQRSCLRNMRRMEPVFKAIENYSKVIEVLCQGTPYLCFVWVRSTTLSSCSNTDLVRCLQGSHQTHAPGWFSCLNVTAFASWLHLTNHRSLTIIRRALRN